MALYVFDMDGVLWAMEDPIPHGAETVKRLRLRGDRVYFLTNNSTRSREDYVAKLGRFGIRAEVSQVMTSAHATALVLRSEGAAGRHAYVVGERGLIAELEGAGLRVVPYREGDRVDYVVVGWDRSFTYQKLAEAHGAIVRGGAQFIATNRDATYPDSGGRTLPGGGSLVAAVATAAGVAPRTIGKPEPHALDLILREAGVPPEQCIVVGDRLDTDIALGKRAGARTVLVLTGVSTESDVAEAPASLRPDTVLHTLADLP